MKNLFIFFLCMIRVLCFAQQDSVIPFEEAYKRVYRAEKVSGMRPVIDGKLDDPFWQAKGEWSEAFAQVSPNERGATASFTRMKIVYDNQFIYVAVYCREPEPDKMIRFIGNRDDNSIGDLISVAFDTYHDYRAAPEFNINAGGNKTDLIVTDKLEVNRSWNAVWEGRTFVDTADSCWTAELSIPFSQLRYNQLSKDGVWGLHVRRVTRYKSETQNWSLIPLKNNGHVFSFGEMHGMDSLPKPRNMEFLPYVMGKYRREPKIEGSPYQKGNRWNGNAGLDAKFALQDFTLDLTVNPDFGQVELDPSVMNLTTYETFYDEKRPFFLEGKHILDFTANSSNMMFYTRRIGAASSLMPQVDNVSDYAETKENVPIIGALKLTGTNRNGVTIGLIQSLTARSTAKVTRDGKEDKQVVEPLTNYTVARVQKNWKGNVLLGGMITSVNRALSEPYLESAMVRNAYTAGIDYTHYFNNRLYYIDAKAMFSSLNGDKQAILLRQMNSVHYYQRASAAGYLGVDENRTSLNGTGGYVQVGRKGNSKWSFSEEFGWESPGFDLNDIGYLKQADNLRNRTIVQFKQTDVWKIFRSNTILLSQGNEWNYGGKTLSRDVYVNWTTMFLNRFEFSLYQSYGWDRLETRQLRGGPDLLFDPFFYTMVSFNTDKAKRIRLSLDYNGSHMTDGYNNYNTLSPGISIRAGNHIHLTGQFDYSWNTDNLQYVGTITPISGDATIYKDPIYVMGRMKQRTYGITLKAQANITPDVSIQFYASPFTSTATYSHFKEAADTESKTYSERFNEYAPGSISYANEVYTAAGPSGKVSFRNPDFSFNEFRSNLVARWEYMPGSTLYLVWEHRMSDQSARHISGWGNNLDRMFGLPTTNTFMIKLNYWFNL